MMLWGTVVVIVCFNVCRLGRQYLKMYPTKWFIKYLALKLHWYMH